MSFDKVAQVLAEYKEMDVADIKLETTFEELDLDSLDTVELVMALEDQLEIALEMDENIKSVADVVAAVDKAQA